MAKLKPILFNTEMVQKIMAGKKTETRRVVLPQPEGARFVLAVSYTHLTLPTNSRV